MEFLKKGLCTLLSKQKNSEHGNSLNILTSVLSTRSNQKKMCVAIFEQPKKADTPKKFTPEYILVFCLLQEKEILNGKKNCTHFWFTTFFLLVKKKTTTFVLNKKLFKNL